MPMAAKRHIQPTVYDPKKPQELLSAINASKVKRVLVVGHSNTIPPLANLLMNKQLFRDLEDSEYSTIWIIRMKNGKVTKVELLDY